MSDSVRPQTAAHQAPLSLGFSRQEHRSGLPFPSTMHESEKWKWSRSVVSNSSYPMDCSLPLQAPPSMGFSRQKYWSGVPLPSPRTSIRADKNKTIIGLILSIENKRGYPSLLLLFYYFRKLKLISTFSSFWNTYKFFEKLDRSFVSFMTRNVFLKYLGTIYLE